MQKVLKHPACDDEWKVSLRNFSMKVGFHLSLSTSMLEMLCAVSDDVKWDRALYYRERCVGENWISSQNSLVKRGLIRRKSEDEMMKEKKRRIIMEGTTADFCQWSNYELTPAGELVVALIAMAGLFVEADAAIEKKAKKA
jgi:hypothetical protein